MNATNKLQIQSILQMVLIMHTFHPTSRWQYIANDSSFKIQQNMKREVSVPSLTTYYFFLNGNSHFSLNLKLYVENPLSVRDKNMIKLF